MPLFLYRNEVDPNDTIEKLFPSSDHAPAYIFEENEKAEITKTYRRSATAASIRFIGEGWGSNGPTSKQGGRK